MKQYTVRNIPQDLDAKLRGLADRQKRSLNQTIVNQLQKSMATPTSKATTNHDYDDLIGKMVPDAEFDKIIKAGRQIDAEDWQ